MPAVSVKANIARAAILKRIARERMKPGDRIPSELQLASDLKMNHQTVRRGLAKLVEEGVIVKQPNVGSFVRPIGPLHANASVALILPENYFHIDVFSPTAHLYDGARRVLTQERSNVSILRFRAGRLWEDAGRVAAENGARGALLVATSGR